MIPAPTPVPTPRTDAFYGCPPPESGKDWQTRGTKEEREFASQLETELTHAIASLALAQARCVAKNAALLSLENYARYNPPNPDFPTNINRFSLITNSQLALADNCAAPWIARFDRRTKALEDVNRVRRAMAELQIDFFVDGGQRAYPILSNAVEALEDQ